MRRHRPWCVVIADKVMVRYSSEERAKREADRMRRQTSREPESVRVAFIPSRTAQSVLHVSDSGGGA